MTASASRPNTVDMSDRVTDGYDPHFVFHSQHQIETYIRLGFKFVTLDQLCHDIGAHSRAQRVGTLWGVRHAKSEGKLESSGIDSVYKVL